MFDTRYFPLMSLSEGNSIASRGASVCKGFSLVSVNGLFLPTSQGRYSQPPTLVWGGLVFYTYRGMPLIGVRPLLGWQALEKQGKKIAGESQVCWWHAFTKCTLRRAERWHFHHTTSNLYIVSGLKCKGARTDQKMSFPWKSGGLLGSANRGHSSPHHGLGRLLGSGAAAVTLPQVPQCLQLSSNPLLILCEERGRDKVQATTDTKV